MPTAATNTATATANPVAMLQDGGYLGSEDYSAFIEAAAAMDWDAAWDATLDSDGDSTDATSELGDMVVALYWHCTEWHGGQDTTHYSLQCKLGEIYTPGCGESGPEAESSSRDFYDMLDSAANATYYPADYVGGEA